ncbi:MAG TPA: site-specific integrase [Planctomycetota bacterium]|nr:site-specific integrase [Planctomycetota bacterium]
MTIATTKPRARRKRRRFGRVYPRPGGPGWLVQYPDPTGAKAPSGRTRYLTRSVDSKAEGEALAKEIERSVLLGQFAAPAERAPACDLTLLDALDAYLDSKRSEGRSKSGIRRYLVSRRAIAASPLAARTVSGLQPGDIEQYMKWRRGRKWRAKRRSNGEGGRPVVEVVEVRGEEPSNSSVNRDVAFVSAALGRLVRLGQLERNPARRVTRGREPVKARAVLSKEEVGCLLEACGDNFRPFAMACYYAGQRPGELLALRWGDVSFGNRTLTVFRTKVGLGDSIPLHPTLAAELRALKERRAKEEARVVQDDEHVFLSKGGRPQFDYRRPWWAALMRAGLDRRKGLTLYSLRHSFATHFLEHGAPSDLQQIMGHASYSTTARYVRSVSARARAGIEALEAGPPRGRARAAEG